MPDATIKRLDEMESFYNGLVTRARAELGVTSWGMQVFDLPPHFDQYPNHHTDSSPASGRACDTTIFWTRSFAISARCGWFGGSARIT
jgi:hypothetical protein